MTIERFKSFDVLMCKSKPNKMSALASVHAVGDIMSRQIESLSLDLVYIGCLGEHGSI